MKRRARLTALLSVLAVLVALVLASGSVRAAEPNRWEWLRAAPATGVHAHLALGNATVGQAVYISVGGSDFLDVVQIGAKRDATGRHLFAAWGSGEPGTGYYREIDLGPVGKGSHPYTLRLRDGVWRLRTQHRLIARVDDGFRDWTPRSVKAANETETGGPLGGTARHPVRISGARTWHGGWVTPRWRWGGYREPASMRSMAGRDWLLVWRR